MINVIIQFLINHLSELISGTIGGIVGSGITLSWNKYISNKQNSQNNKNINNSQITQSVNQ